MGVVDDVTTFLAAQGLVGGATGWQCFRRRMTDQPATDQAVVVSEDGGSSLELKTAEGIGDSALADPGVLVSVRARQWDGDASYAKALAIIEALHSRFSQTLVASGTVYFRVRAMTPDPVFTGYDDQGRPIHTIAFRLLKAA